MDETTTNKDPKSTRITVRISDDDMTRLQCAAQNTGSPIGAIVRKLIRENLTLPVEQGVV